MGDFPDRLTVLTFWRIRGQRPKLPLNDGGMRQRGPPYECGRAHSAPAVPWLKFMMDFVPAGVSAGISPVPILGVPFDHVTAGQAIQRIEEMIASRRPHYVVTPNVDFLVQAQRDPELHRILLEAHLVLCDGMPVLWASRLLRNPLPERVAGADLAPLLIRVAAAKGYRLFLLGASPDSAAKAVARLGKKHPNLILAGHYSPPVRELFEMDHEEMCARIRKAAPDILLVAFGCPKQEKWISRHYRSLGVPVVIGCGATIDFLGGQLRRAPMWMRRSGMEWLFRMLQEPRRLFRRYTRDLRVFGWNLLSSWWRLPLGRAQGGQEQTATWGDAGEYWQWLKLPGQLSRATAAACLPLAERVTSTGHHCLLELADTEYVDGAGVGLLIGLQKALQTKGCRLILLAPSLAVQHALKLMRLQDFFVSVPDFDTARQAIETPAAENSVPCESAFRV
jgi:N-acetylglucosaminyldiphosphoundecaprenol N-acetyl-beta-D-mannosaminyltransferase